MSVEVPSGFLDLHHIHTSLGAEFNVMGVVTDYLPPTRSRGTDWMSTFTIADHTSGYDDGQKVKFFRPQESDLPLIQGTGDVVVLRNVKATNYSGTRIVLSSWRTTWAIFPQNAIPESSPSTQLKLDCVKQAKTIYPTAAEMQYAISLCNSRDRGLYSVPAIPTPSENMAPLNGSDSAFQSRQEKFSLIKDIKVDTYYDLVGQVVKVFASHDRLDLYITDYTINSLLYNYEWGRDEESGVIRDGDEYGYVASRPKTQWKGPYGKRTLSLTLWNPHSYWAQTNVKENNFVFLRNVHIKWSNDGKMEGVLHSDKKWPDRIDVSILDIKDTEDDRVKDVLRRKKDYTKQFITEKSEFVNEARSQGWKKGDNDVKLSKVQLKRKRQQERKREEDEKKSKGRTNTIESKSENTNVAAIGAARNVLNKNIICTHTTIPPRTVSSILDTTETHAHTTPSGTSLILPFQNICTRTTVRVVDFFPFNLADFTVRSEKTSEFDALSDNDDSDSSDPSISDSSSDSGNSAPTSPTASGVAPDENSDSAEKLKRKWEWRFCLLLEDATPGGQKEKERMRVYVVGQDAEFLTKLDARNLRKSPKTLDQLREKLFLLWGDLEECKNRSRALQDKSGNMTVKVGKQQAAGTINGRGEDQGQRMRPFQCCIKEYGVKVQGKWERRFRMFGTTII